MDIYPSRWEVDGDNFYAIGALILWDINLGYDHGESRLMSIELGVVPWSEHKLVILYLMFHDGIDSSVGHVRVEYIDFEDSHPMNMDM